MDLPAVKTPAREPAPLDTELLAGQLARLQGRWLAELDVAPATKQTYRRGLALFLAWLPGWGQTLTAYAIRCWRDSLHEAGHQPSSVNTWLAGVRSFFTWALEAGLVPYDPTAGVRGRRRRGVSTSHKRDELTAGEVRRVLATCKETAVGRRDRAMLALMAYCALRQIEVQRADVADLQTRDGRLILWVQGKGHLAKDAFVVLPAAAETAVREWLAERPPGGPALFVGLGNRNRGRLSTRSIRRIVKWRFKQAGVVGEAKTTHSLRHSAISSAIRNGAQLQQVQAMARHANIGTTLIYHHEINRTSNPAEDFVRYE